MGRVHRKRNKNTINGRNNRAFMVSDVKMKPRPVKAFTTGIESPSDATDPNTTACRATWWVMVGLIFRYSLRNVSTVFSAENGATRPRLNGTECSLNPSASIAVAPSTILVATCTS